VGDRGTKTALVVVVATLLLAACSGGGDGAAGDRAAATGSTARVATTTTSGTSATSTTGPPLVRYAGYRSHEYDDRAHWLCWPGADDVCAGDLDTTVVAADGTVTPEPFEPAADPPVDCFYVYPTISRDPGGYSDWNASDDEEGYAALNQAARLRAHCRLFAPIYRQRTLAGLAGALGGSTPGTGTAAASGQQGDPYADVLDAFRTYMAEENHGRGVVLVGHSQGASLLGRLVREEVAPHPDVRDRLVAAYLAGSAVPADARPSDGWLPLCRTSTDTGCIVTWASFRATAPPPADSLFGAVRGEGAVAACTNPAALGGGSAELHAYFPANPKASILAALGSGGGDGGGWLPGASIPTPFVSLPGLVSGECVDDGSHQVLSITVHPDPGPRADDIGGDLTPQWGLHLVDLALVMGDVVDLVGSQANAWAAGR
jgi:hypothetical protein